MNRYNEKQLICLGISTVLIYLHLHGVGVHLAHVLSTVLPPDTAYVEGPRVEVVVCDGEPRVVSYNVLVNGEDGFGVRLNPRYLIQAS